MSILNIQNLHPMLIQLSFQWTSSSVILPLCKFWRRAKNTHVLFFQTWNFLSKVWKSNSLILSTYTIGSPLCGNSIFSDISKIFIWSRNRVWFHYALNANKANFTSKKCTFLQWTSYLNIFFIWIRMVLTELLM